NWEQVWCYYRNLVHTVYREIRHIGESGDKEAKYQVPNHYLPAAQQCRKHRQTLKLSVLFHNAKGVKTDDVIHCYEALRGSLKLDYPSLCGMLQITPGWRYLYGAY